MINAETWAACGHLVETGPVGEDVARRLLAASKTTASDVQAAERVRAAFTAQVDAALRDFPVLALPTMADAPPRVAEATDTSKLVGMTSLVRPFNLSGHPAIAIPLPAGEFPMSLQLVAARHFRRSRPSGRRGELQDQQPLELGKAAAWSAEVVGAGICRRRDGSGLRAWR